MKFKFFYLQVIFWVSNQYCNCQILPYGCGAPDYNIYFIGADGAGTGDGDVWHTEWIDAHESVYCPEEADGWILAFEDQFNHSGIDEAIWQIAPGAIYHPENGLTYSVDRVQAVSINRIGNDDADEYDGYLHIKHSEISPVDDWQNINEAANVIINGTPNYHQYSHAAGGIWTRQELPQGKYVARIKIPTNDRTWPAFWAWHGWNGYQEVDGFEFKTGQECYHDDYNKKISYAIHGSHGCSTDPSVWGQGKLRYCSDIIFSDDFHEYAYDWDPGRIVYALDGSEMQVFNKLMHLAGVFHVDNCEGPDVGQLLKVCRIMPDKFTNMNLLLGSAFGKALINNNCGFGSPLPDDMLVDWFKYYIKINCSAVKNITDYHYSWACNESSPSVYAAGTINVAGNGNSVVVREPHSAADRKYNNANGPLFNEDHGDYMTLVASQEINLLPGFEAIAGSNFEGMIHSCNDPAVFMGKSDEERNISFLDSKTEHEDIKIISNIAGMTLFPNPSTGKFIISYSLPKSTEVEFYITDVFGERVFTIAQNTFSYSGSYTLKADDVNLISGSYFVTMKTSAQSITKGIIVIN